MARKDKKDKKAEGGEGTPAKSGKSKLVMGALVAVALVGGVKGFVLGGGKAAAGAAGPATTTTTAPGPVVTLEPVTLNIAGGQFLKVGLALQLSGEHVGDAHAKDGDDPTKGYARAVDIAIEVLGGRKFDELVTPEGRTVVKEELVHRLEEAYPHQVEGLYFTQFVMQ
jgi:flagellar protein FliL